MIYQKYTKKSDIYPVVETICKQLNIEPLAKLIRIDFNDRLIVTAGQAFTTTGNKIKHIQFSPAIFSQFTLTERLKIITHEVCHVVAEYKHKNIKPHGKEWKNLMILLGYNPDRCFDLSSTGWRNHPYMFETLCCCGHQFVTKRTFNKLERFGWICPKCHYHIDKLFGNNKTKLATY